MLLIPTTSPVKDYPQGLLLKGLEQSKTCKWAMAMLCDSPSALMSSFWGSLCYHDNHSSQQVTFEIK